MATHLSDTYLSDIEKTKLQGLNEDKVLLEAIRKVMLEPLYLHGVFQKDGVKEGLNDPTRNFVLTPVFNMLLGKRENWDNEKLGEWTRACAMSIQFVEQGFGTIERYKKIVEKGVDKTGNPGE